MLSVIGYVIIVMVGSSSDMVGCCVIVCIVFGLICSSVLSMNRNMVMGINGCVSVVSGGISSLRLMLYVSMVGLCCISVVISVCMDEF